MIDHLMHLIHLNHPYHTKHANRLDHTKHLNKPDNPNKPNNPNNPNNLYSTDVGILINFCGSLNNPNISVVTLSAVISLLPILP